MYQEHIRKLLEPNFRTYDIKVMNDLRKTSLKKGIIAIW